MAALRTDSLGAWTDRNAGRLMIMPAVLLLLGLAIFPLLVSAYMALSRFRLAPGGYRISFIGFGNFEKLLTGSQQYHLLGTFGGWGLLQWFLLSAFVVAVGAMFYRFLARGAWTVLGLLGRTIAAMLCLALVPLVLATIAAPAGFPGSLAVTLFYVFAGVALQFGLGLGLAMLCARAIRFRNLFRVVFFIPLMVTPVGIAYTFRMLADMHKGPFAPISQFFGAGEWAWATDPWSARLVVLIGDTWQWTPFMFIVLLAALESQPHDRVEAARIDGASDFQIFRHITWPGIAPVAATVVLIRLIEAFKIVDLPNVLTNGGPGIATESMTLHAFIAWRTQDLGGSAAVGYTLLFIATVTCVSFFNFVARPARRFEG
ncbi:MAG: carbohydrate ABC transporter permease [Propylenella sp.]